MNAPAAPVPDVEPQKEETYLRALMPLQAFKPDRVNVIAPDPGQTGNLFFQAFVGPVGPDTFLHCTAIELDPDAAISLGQYLVEEGRRVKSGLVIARGGPVDLRA